MLPDLAAIDAEMTKAAARRMLSEIVLSRMPSLRQVSAKCFSAAFVSRQVLGDLAVSPDHSR
jgi:hypothetical protein